MAVRSKSHWSGTISSILKTAELNLSKIPRPQTTTHHQPDSSIKHRRPISAYDEPENLSTLPREIAQTRKAIEELLNEKHRHYRTAFEKSHNRLSRLETQQDELKLLEREVGTALEDLENRTLTGIRGLENSLSGRATRTDLKLIEKAVKRANLSQFSQVSLEFSELQHQHSSLKEDVFKQIEETMRSHLSTLVPQDELTAIQDRVSRETTAKLAHYEAAFQEKFGFLASKVRDQYTQLENKMREIEGAVLKQHGEASKQLEGLNSSLSHIQAHTTDELAQLKDTFKQLESGLHTEDFHSEIQGLRTQIAACDLSKYSKCADLRSVRLQLAQQDSKFQSIQGKLSCLESRIHLAEPLVKIENLGLVKISLNELGESDDESQGFASPIVSPLNQVLGLQPPKLQKHSMFNSATIVEDLCEDESATPESDSQLFGLES